MSATLNPSSPGQEVAIGTDEQILRSRLSGLRKWLRFVICINSFCRLAVLFLASFLLIGYLDYLSHLPNIIRACALFTLSLGLGIVLIRNFVQPLIKPSDDLSLALKVEERFPLLNDSLASTIEFLNQAEVKTDSLEMRQETIRRTLKKIEGLPFNQVVETQGLGKMIGLSCFFVAIFTLVTGFFPLHAKTAFSRLTLPFEPFPWPKKTQIEMEDFPQRIGKNRDLRIKGKITGVVPPEIHADIFSDGIQVVRKTFAIHPEKHTFNAHLKPDEIYRNFRLKFTANDASTPEFDIEVLPLPSLGNFNGQPTPQIQVEPPPYAEIQTFSLTPGNGNLDLLLGSRIRLTAVADRPLKQAWVTFQPEVKGVDVSTCLALLGLPGSFGSLCSISLLPFHSSPLAGELSQENRQIEFTFQPLFSGMYTLNIEDENQLENSRTYDLRIRPDLAPQVRMERPSPSKDVLQVLPNASLPVQLSVDDQGAAIRSVWLRYRLNQSYSPLDVPLFDFQGKNLFVAGALGGVGFRTGGHLNLRPKNFETQMTFHVGSLTGSDGNMLKEGDMISLQALADDFDDIHPAKEPGKSHEIIIRVVGKDTLEMELNKEQAKIQKELQDLLKNQREALERTREIEIPVRRGIPIPSEKDVSRLESLASRLDQEAAETQKKVEESKDQFNQGRLQQLLKQKQDAAEKQRILAQDLKKQVLRFNEAEQIQQQLRERIGSEKDGLRGEIQRLQETMRRNGLDNTNNMERMARTLRELERISNSELEGIESRLHNAKSLSNDSDSSTISKEEKSSSGPRKSALPELQNGSRNENKEDRENNTKNQSNDLKIPVNPEKETPAKLNPELKNEGAPTSSKRFDPLLQRSLLSEARRGQEEVERTLNQILQEMEPWSSTLEVNSEAGRILQDQKSLQSLLEEFNNKGQTGKSLNELSEPEKIDLKNAAESQKRLQDRSLNLLEQMKRLAEKHQNNDPEMSKDLRKAAEEAVNGQLDDQMRSAKEHISRNEIQEARKRQQTSVEQLEKLIKGLKDSRESRLSALARKLRESQDRVEKIMDEQEKLQRKIREAEKITDPVRREQELNKIAPKQEELQKKAEEIRDELARLGNERTRQSMAEAVEEMAEAVKQLSRGQKSNDKQEDILDRMEEARRNLEKAREKTEEELGREQIIRVVDILRGLRDRQESLMKEGERIQEAAISRKGWSRGLKASLRDLGQNQLTLSVETTEVARKDLQATPVFAKLLSFISRSMDQSAGRLNEFFRISPDWKSLPDKTVSKYQFETLRRFDLLLASMKDALDNPRPLSRSTDPDATDAGPGKEKTGTSSDDHIPSNAQIKLLRSLQNEILEQTLSFNKKHPSGSLLSTEEKDELIKIQKEQKELADLLQRLFDSEEDSEESLPKPSPSKEKGGDKQ